MTKNLLFAGQCSGPLPKGEIFPPFCSLVPLTHLHHFSHDFSLTASVWLSFLLARGFATIALEPDSALVPFFFSYFFFFWDGLVAKNSFDPLVMGPIVGRVGNLTSWPTKPELFTALAPASMFVDSRRNPILFFLG